MSNAIDHSYLRTLEEELEDTSRGLVALSLELENSIRRYSDILEHSIQGIYRVDTDGQFQFVNPAFARMLGFDSVDEFLECYRSADQLYLQTDRRARLLQGLEEDENLRAFTSEAKTCAGDVVLLSENVHRNESKGGSIDSYESIVEDITFRHQAEERLLLLSNVFEYSLEGILITDADNRIITVNRAYEEISGFSSQELIGKNPNVLFSGWQGSDFYRAMWQEINENGMWQGEIKDRRKSGEVFVVWLTVCAIKDKAGKVVNHIGICNDITAKKQSEKAIKELAYYDVLTKLPNRLLFHDRLNQAISSAHRAGKKLAILFIDMDNFKAINDTLGHLVGDQFLIAVAELLKQCVRDNDTVARLGGDEFVILAKDIKSHESAYAIARKVLEKLSRPVVVDNNELHSGASIGISIFPDDGDNSDNLIKHADTAMYDAKENGKNDYRFYSEEMNARMLERIRIEGDLRRAIENDEFCLYYQPKISIQSGKVAGAEALIRWNHPELGLVFPNSFIPIAEETGLINPMGEWIISEAFRQVATWSEQSVGLIPPVAINLSARQLSDLNLFEGISRKMQSVGCDYRSVEFEITESSVMENPDHSSRLLHQLRDMGCSISLDDFGTGYSSLSYLKQLPIHTLKIDGSFVQELPEDKDSRILSESIIALSHKMALNVIAECVENREQLQYLIEQGCDEIQGYLFSKPLPADEYRDFLLQWEGRNIVEETLKGHS